MHDITAAACSALSIKYDFSQRREYSIENRALYNDNNNNIEYYISEYRNIPNNTVFIYRRYCFVNEEKTVIFRNCHISYNV